MFIELIDKLRCPASHRDSWLVARMDRIQNRHVITGALGCPVCGAEYQIDEGVVKFSQVTTPASPTPDPEAAVRIAAGLGLVAANDVGVLHGAWGAHAELVRSLSPAQLILVNPPAGVESSEGISIVLAETAPFATAAVDAAAIDGTAGEAMQSSVIRAVKHGGRLLSTLRPGATEPVTEVLTSDALWIGEVHHPVPIVPLRRLPRS